MREVIFIQLGQCGNKIGDKFWEHLSLEHSINQDGAFYGTNEMQLERINVYYNDNDDRFVPRCVQVDLDPSTANALKGSNMYTLYSPESLILGKSSAGNNWSKGYYTEGAELMDDVLDYTRRLAEKCDCLQGFQVVHSIGGGSGSGMGSLMTIRLQDEYPDRILQTFSVIPSLKISQVVVEPYNSVLCLSSLISTTNETICLDNEAVYDICTDSLNLEKPSHCDMNHLITYVMSGITTCFRFPGQLNTDLRKLYVNMVPYPKLHFFITGFTPLVSNMNLPYKSVDVQECITQIFDNKTIMVKCDISAGKYLTLATIFRGLLSTREIDFILYKIQVKLKKIFVDFIPNNIKIAICDIPPIGLKLSTTFLGNTTAICSLFTRLNEKFNAMLKHKAFLHWYTGEGMEEMEFTDASELLNTLIDDYIECENCTSEIAGNKRKESFDIPNTNSTSNNT